MRRRGFVGALLAFVAAPFARVAKAPARWWMLPADAGSVRFEKRLVRASEELIRDSSVDVATLIGEALPSSVQRYVDALNRIPAPPRRRA